MCRPPNSTPATACCARSCSPELVGSTGEARRQIRGGGLRINDVVIESEKATIGRDALQEGGLVKLSLGKKNHVLLRAV